MAGDVVLPDLPLESIQHGIGVEIVMEDAANAGTGLNEGGAPKGGGQQVPPQVLEAHVEPLTDSEREKLVGTQILRELNQAEAGAARAQSRADFRQASIDELNTEIAELEGQIATACERIKEIDSEVSSLQAEIVRSHENQERIVSEQLDEKNQVQARRMGKLVVTSPSLEASLENLKERRQYAQRKIESLNSTRNEIAQQKLRLQGALEEAQGRLAPIMSEAANLLNDTVPFWNYVYRLRKQARVLVSRIEAAEDTESKNVGQTREVETDVGDFRSPFGHDQSSSLPWLTTFIDEAQLSSIGRAWQGYKVVKVATYTYREDGIWWLTSIHFRSQKTNAIGSFDDGQQAAIEVLNDLKRINQEIHDSRVDTPDTIPGD